jgi:hypothetical protein
VFATRSLSPSTTVITFVNQQEFLSALQYGILGFSMEIFLRSFRGSSSQRPDALQRAKQTLFHQSGLSTHSENPTISHTPPPARSSVKLNIELISSTRKLS